MKTKEEKLQEEKLAKQRKQMIFDIEWSIEYHTKKLEEFKLSLQLLIN